MKIHLKKDTRDNQCIMRKRTAIKTDNSRQRIKTREIALFS